MISRWWVCFAFNDTENLLTVDVSQAEKVTPELATEHFDRVQIEYSTF